MTSHVISIFLLAITLNLACSEQSLFNVIDLNENTPPTECPEYDDPNKNIHIAHESDCTKFYQCSHGVKYLKCCDAGLHFNPHLQVCDNPLTAGCTPNGGHTTPSTTTSTTPSTTTSTTPSTTTSTTPSTTTSTTPSTTTSTTPLTTTSTTPSTTTSTTPSTTTSTTPSTTTSTTPSTTTSTTPSTTTSTTPSTTTSTTPSTTTSTTPSTTTSTTPSTTTSTTPSTTTSTTPSTTTSAAPPSEYPTTCPKKDTPNRIFLPHECICGKYYACYKGLQILQQCPSNQHFNPSTHACDAPEDAGCQNVTPSTVKPSTVTPDPPSSKDCPPNNIGEAVHLPHETDCSLFYKCNFGKKVLQECPAGLYFDPTLEVCNWASEVDCKLN